MPILDQLLAYNETYTKRFVTDAFDLNYAAVHSAQPYTFQEVKKGFSLKEQAKEKLKQVFELRKKYNVFLLFIDITSFSEKIRDKSGDYICGYLDEYYKQVIPIVYDYDGQVEKIMGDGIICVFGPPFMNATIRDCMVNAEECAMRVIRKFKDTKYSSKVALHYGEIVYYKNSNVEYEEYTMIGSPVTELFRLESISNNNAINYFTGTMFDEYIRARIVNTRSSGIVNAPWIVSDPVTVSLKGVGYSHMKYMSLVW